MCVKSNPILISTSWNNTIPYDPFLKVKTSTSLHSLNFPKFQLVIPYNVFLINKIACILISFRAFSSTRIYRELKLRSSILQGDKQLKVLPLENVVSWLDGVWNLSSDQGNLGTLIVTNVRLIFIPIKGRMSVSRWLHGKWEYYKRNIKTLS